MLKCQWRKNFYCPVWKPLQSQEDCIYRFLISLLVPELLSFKDLKNDNEWCQVIAGESPNTIPTNIWTAGSSGERTSQVMFYVSQRLMESISGSFLI